MTASFAQRDLFTRRYRKATPANALVPSEVQTQISLIGQLRWLCRPGVVYFHCPNGELRDKRSAAKLKAMGVLPGVSDLMFFWAGADGRPAGLFLELKARGRELTEDQAAFGKAVKAAGFSFEWTDSLDDAVRILRQYGILP